MNEENPIVDGSKPIIIPGTVQEHGKEFRSLMAAGGKGIIMSDDTPLASIHCHRLGHGIPLTLASLLTPYHTGLYKTGEEMTMCESDCRRACQFQPRACLLDAGLKPSFQAY